MTDSDKYAEAAGEYIVRIPIDNDIAVAEKEIKGLANLVLEVCGVAYYHIEKNWYTNDNPNPDFFDMYCLRIKGLRTYHVNILKDLKYDIEPREFTSIRALKEQGYRILTPW